MWESPIEIIKTDIQTRYEENVMKAVLSCGINVNKEELIKALQYDRQQYKKGYEDAKAEQQWIPCSERLPQTNGVYNVTRKISDGFECRNISDSCYYDGAYTWHDDTRVNHKRRYLTDVIAWMPLPEPYRKGADNEVN